MPISACLPVSVKTKSATFAIRILLCPLLVFHYSGKADKMK